MIKIGIEVSSRNLRCDLLENPGRYFFIREADSRASLCIQTCNSQGEDIKTHIVDALSPNGEGNLYSIFEDDINDAILERLEWKRHSCLEDRYPISSQLEQALSVMPDFMDWIISSILANGRNLVIYPSEDTL
jgi:hypothetical protein